MDAWTILTSNSTIPVNGVNTTWDHLNNQDGSGTVIAGGEPFIVPVIDNLRIVDNPRILNIKPTKSLQLSIKSSLNTLVIVEPTGESNEIKIR